MGEDADESKELGIGYRPHIDIDIGGGGLQIRIGVRHIVRVRVV